MEPAIKAQLRELNAKVEKYINARRLSEAIALAQKAMSLVEEVTTLADEPGIYSMQLQLLGSTYLQENQDDLAQATLNKCYEIRKQYFGSNHPIIGTTLRLLAVVASRKDDSIKAKELLSRAIKIWQVSFSEEHPFIVQATEDLQQLNKVYEPVKEALNAYNDATTQLRKANYADAEILFKLAISINREKLGFDHLDVARCLVPYANLLRETARETEAVSAFKEALYIAKKHKKHDIHQYASVLAEYANMVKGQGRYFEAKEMFDEVFSLDPGFAEDDLLKVKNNYASLLNYLGDKNQALDILDKVIDQAKAASEQDIYFLAVPIANKASILSDMGKVKEALVLYNEALLIKEKNYSNNHPSYARTLLNIASLHSNLGDYKESSYLLEQVRDIFYGFYGEDHPEYVRCLLLIANISKANKNKKKTRELYNSAHAIVLRFNPRDRLTLAEIEKNLAVLEDDETSIILSIRNELSIYLEAYGDHALPTVDTKLNLASRMLETEINKRSDSSSAIFKEIEQLLIEAKSVLEIHYEKDNLLSECLTRLAILYKYKREEEQSYECISKALETFKEHIKQVFAITSEKLRLQHSENLGFTLDLYLSILVSLPPDLTHKYISDAANFIVNLKNIIVDVIAGERSLIQSSVLSEHRKTYERIYELRTIIAARMVVEYSIVNKDEEDELAEWIAEKEKLEASVALKLSYVNIIESLVNVNMDDIQANLSVDAAIVDIIEFKDCSFYWGGDYTGANHCLLCLVRKNEQPTFISLDYTDSLMATIKGFTDHLATQEIGLVAVDPIVEILGKRLRSKLIDPLMPFLGGIRSLRFCPDGIFWNFPFEAIPLGDGDFLIDRYEISYLSSIRDIAKKYEKASPERNVVIADPNFDFSDTNYPRIDEQEMERLAQNNIDLFGMSITYKDENPHAADLDLYENLSGTRVEGEIVAKLLNAKCFFGDEVLEKYIKNIRRPGILHIATHGFFFESASTWATINSKRIMASKTYNFGETQLLMRSFAQNMLDALTPLGFDEDSDENDNRRSFYQEEKSNPMICSGLVLAGVNTWMKRGSLSPEAQDCHLLAEDILGVDLLGTQLVTLSACDSGKGLTKSKTGIYGMRRAFVLAGAETLVMSLWKVPDLQTQEFMQVFYKLIMDNKARSTALQESKLWMKKKYGLPYYWAAFILQGKTEPISN